MSRPPKEGLEYFAHDVDLSKSDKISELEILYGNDGYAIYLKLLERIYKKGGELTISAAETTQILSRKCNVTVERFLEIINKAVSIGLFSTVEYKKGILTSDEIKRRAGYIFRKRAEMKKRYENKISAAETIPETPQSKVKESKVKESKGKTYMLPAATPKDKFLDFCYFTKDEYEKLVLKFGQAGTDERIEHLNLYALQIGEQKFKKYKSHYATLLNWERRNTKNSTIQPTVPEGKYENL